MNPQRIIIEVDTDAEGNRWYSISGIDAEGDLIEHEALDLDTLTEVVRTL